MHFVLIGHLTRDIVPGGYTLGGTVSFSGITARRLGADVTILTRSHPDDIRHPSLAGIDIINLPSDRTSTFKNSYQNGARTQYITAIADPISVDDVPQHLFDADIAQLAPLTQEVDPAIAPRMNGLLGATPQGWLRAWDDEGRVSPVRWQGARHVLPHLDAIVFSDADLIGDPTLVAVMVQTVPLVVITKSSAGAIIYVNGEYNKIPPRHAEEVDPTGAGDVFAAAFLMQLHQSGDPLHATYFANVTASMAVEAPGTEGIPDRARVEAYIAEHPLLIPRTFSR